MASLRLANDLSSGEAAAPGDVRRCRAFSVLADAPGPEVLADITPIQPAQRSPGGQK